MRCEIGIFILLPVCSFEIPLPLSRHRVKYEILFNLNLFFTWVTLHTFHYLAYKYKIDNTFIIIKLLSFFFLLKSLKQQAFCTTKILIIYYHSIYNFYFPIKSHYRKRHLKLLLILEKCLACKSSMFMIAHYNGWNTKGKVGMFNRGYGMSIA